MPEQPRNWDDFLANFCPHRLRQLLGKADAARQEGRLILVFKHQSNYEQVKRQNNISELAEAACGYFGEKLDVERE